MSAWTVTQTHISTLVSAAMRFEVPYNGEPVNLLNATAIGQDLWNVNYQSVNYRYGEHDNYYRDCPSNDHSNIRRDNPELPKHHSDGGYALKHRWM